MARALIIGWSLTCAFLGIVALLFTVCWLMLQSYDALVAWLAVG